MAHISIIGSGNMGQAISGLAAKGGSSVELFNSADADRKVTGDIVVLAVPYAAVAGVVEARREEAEARQREDEAQLEARGIRATLVVIR